MLSSDEVTKVFHDSLFRNDEIVDDKPTSKPVYVHGVQNSVGFHSERLKANKTKVQAMLDELPYEFQPTNKEGGGGWSFLNMCLDKHGNQWTGEHRVMEQLCLLSIGLELAKFTPKVLWAIHPGNVPYFCIC